MSAIAFLSTLSLLFLGSHAQKLGVTTCACQPATYEFTLDFNLGCGDRDVRAGNPGIVDSACVLNTQGNQNVTDFVPVRVTEIQILELDQNLQVIFQTTKQGNFINGSVFNYTSITQTMPNKLNSTSIPKGIQVFLTGRNAQEQDLVNFWAIVYDNACGIFPLLTVGEKMGWTIFSDLGAPPRFLCPAVGPAAPSAAPFAATTPVPTPPVKTGAPSKSPSQAPVAATIAPPPTRAPTTSAPIKAPTTSAPIKAPTTSAPTRAPTRAPTTSAPTVSAATSAPVIAPVATAPTFTIGCPPLGALPSSSPVATPVSLKGGGVPSPAPRNNRKLKRGLMVSGNTASPSFCAGQGQQFAPPVASRPTGNATPTTSTGNATPTIATTLPGRPHEGSPKKKQAESKSSKRSMQKISKGTSSRRRFLMEPRDLY
jgi:hypothetical protein